MSSSTGDNARKAGEAAGETIQDRDLKHTQAEPEEGRVQTDIPTGKPQQPVSDESQFMPDTGETMTPTTDRPRKDIMDEARDGFMDRHPPKGQTD